MAYGTLDVSKVIKIIKMWINLSVQKKATKIIIRGQKYHMKSD